MAGAPATTIAIAGSQYSKKTRHRLERMSRDLQVEALDSTLLLRYQGYSKIWSTVQSQAKIAVELGTVTPSQREIALINSRTEFLGCNRYGFESQLRLGHGPHS